MSDFLKVKVCSKSLDHYLLLITFIFMAIGIYFRFEAFEVVRINEWVIRDFDRAFHLFDGDYIPLAGSERNAGGRLLGPFLYFFLTIPLFFSYSYESIYAFNLVLNVASLIFFFWMIRKYFGVITGAFASILLAVNIVHLDSAGFPINPTFMFPLTFIFLWFLFKVVIENEIKYFPWIFVVISLGIQMHFSMAAYYLIPLITCLLFKIKINQKEIIKTLTLSFLCFVPYLFYKFQFYEPAIKITETFFKSETSFLSILKIIFLLDIFHLINFGIHLNEFYSIPSYIPKLDYFFSFISFYGVLIFCFLNSRKNSLEKFKKETLLLLTFYIPAIVYEIMRPPSGWHYWHYFIFFLPIILIKARFAYLIIEASKTGLTKFHWGLFIFIFVGFITFVNFQHVIKINKFINSSLRFSNFYNARNLKNLLGALIENFNMTPQAFFANVYLEGVSPRSLQFLKLAKKNLVGFKEPRKANKVCLYGIEAKKVYGNNIRVYSAENERYNILLKDPSIRVGNRQKLIFSGNKINRIYYLHPYETNFNQPCYTDNKNYFVTEKLVRKYLKESYKIDKNIAQDSVIKDISRRADYDKNSKVLKWDKTIIMFNPRLNTPIKIEISLNRKEGKYLIRVDVLYYSWGKKVNDFFQIKNLDLEIVESETQKNKVFASFSIIEPQSLIAKVGSNFGQTENFSWYREFKLVNNIDLRKDKFNMQLNWEVLFPKQKSQCCLKFKTKLHSTPKTTITTKQSKIR